MPPSSLFAALAARSRARKTGGTGTEGGGNATSGRAGISGPSGANAPSEDFKFTDTKSAGNVTTYIISGSDDYIRAFWNIQVTATGNSTSADILGAIQSVQILGPNGPVTTMNPMPDFYYFQQRFSPLHSLPTSVVTTVATVIQGSYTLYGTNLPVAGGPYTMIVTIQSAAAFNTSCTALSVTYSVSFGVGNAGGLVTHYVASGLGFAPAANGSNDLAPIAPVQPAYGQKSGYELIELWMSGFTTMSATGTNDLAYVQISSAGANLGARITSGTLISNANAEMNSPLFSAAQSVSAGSTGYTPTLFLLYPLKTKLRLGAGAHCWLYWTTGTPSSTIRCGYVWAVPVGNSNN
jgi:hypothetical protein